MNENRSYNSKAHKNKDADMLMHSFACKYYFLIAICVRHVTGNDKDYLRKIPRVVW